MADANETERAWFLVQGTVRGGVVDRDGNEREYVVLGNNFRENMREVVMCRDCWRYYSKDEGCVYGDWNEGFCAWGERRKA